MKKKVKVRGSVLIFCLNLFIRSSLRNPMLYFWRIWPYIIIFINLLNFFFLGQTYWKFYKTKGWKYRFSSIYDRFNIYNKKSHKGLKIKMPLQINFQEWHNREREAIQLSDKCILKGYRPIREHGHIKT